MNEQVVGTFSLGSAPYGAARLRTRNEEFLESKYPSQEGSCPRSQTLVRQRP